MSAIKKTIATQEMSNKIPSRQFFNPSQERPCPPVSKLRLTTQMKFFDSRLKGVEQDTGLSQILNERRRQEDKPVGILFVTMNNES